MNRPDLATDPRFNEQTTRSAHEDEIDEIVGDWTREHDLEELERVLEAADVPASRIFTMADIFQNQHFYDREMLLNIPDDDLGAVTLAGVVPKLSETPGSVVWSGHRTGQDTREVLKEIAHLTDADIERLEKENVVYCDPKGKNSQMRQVARARADNRREGL